MPSDDPHNAGIESFAAVVNSRLAAQSYIARAIAFLWLCGGIASAATLTAIGVAIAFWGYSYAISVQSAAEVTSKALVSALQQAKLKTTVTGTMALAPSSEVKLSPNQLVKIASGATIKLDPESSIRVVGDLKVDIPQPSERQLQLDAKSNSGETLPTTDYTIFRAVAFGGGEVVTGWNYGLSDPTKPRVQYCYYSRNIEKGLAAKYTLAFNGTANRPSLLAKTSFDFDGAVGNCLWFSGN